MNMNAGKVNTKHLGSEMGFISPQLPCQVQVLRSPTTKEQAM